MARQMNWRLPDGIDDLLVDRAGHIEKQRRLILDTFESWGYSLVSPPLVEFLDSLLHSNANDLDAETLKFTDHVSGRQLGLRADITPQIVRIYNQQGLSLSPQRLCYVGSVVQATPKKYSGSRNPLQIGAELLGIKGTAADAEIINLLSEVLEVAHVRDVTLELGHMGLFEKICSRDRLTPEAEEEILEVLSMKDRSGLDTVCFNREVRTETKDILIALLDFNGGLEVLDEAGKFFSDVAPNLVQCVEQLAEVVSLVKVSSTTNRLHIDLAELRSYRYHTGVIFAAYTQKLGRAVAWGGRYDNFKNGKSQNETCTGFSTDLKILANLGDQEVTGKTRVSAPPGIDEELRSAIKMYRSEGYTVIQRLPGEESRVKEMSCTKVLVKIGGNWELQDV